MTELKPAVIITGASEGIGRAFAILLAARGERVIAVARHAERLADIGAEAGASVEVLPLDVSEPYAPGEVADFLAARGLYADVVINNAGIGSGGRFDEQRHDDVEQLLNVNIAALVRFSHEFLPGMRERGRGGFINIASLAGFMPGPWQALYFASKAFVLSFSQAIAEECEGSGVRVMVAAPGPVETRIHAAMKTRWSFYRRLFPSYEPDRVAQIIWDGFTQGHRLLVPGVVSNLSAFFASLIPNEILVPIVGFLVRPRFRDGRRL